MPIQIPDGVLKPLGGLERVKLRLNDDLALYQPQPAADPNNPAASTNKFMKYFFPLFSLWVCSSYNAIFALYWVVGNVFAWVQGLVMNKMFEKMDENQVETAGEGTLK